MAGFSNSGLCGRGQHHLAFCAGIVFSGLFALTPVIAGAMDAEDVEFDEVMEWVDAHRDTDPNFLPGEILTQVDLDRLRPFAPPALLKEFDFSGFEAEIQERGRYRPHPSYQSATLQYSKQTALAEDRSLMNYVAGLPFSTERIGEAAPDDAAYMIAWNQVYRWQHYGFATEQEHMAFLRTGEASGRNEPALKEAFQGGGQVERYLTNRYQRVYLNHLAHKADEDFALNIDQADHLHYMDYLAYTHPFEMRGSAMIIERSLDPHEEDQVNAYLPAERKVRRLSAKERADSFQGSEFTIDDFEGFNGRVLEYDWVYRGRKSVIYVADARSDPVVFFGPNSRVPRNRWQLRPCYVIEQRPHSNDHPYGRKLLFIDMETYNIPLAMNFDRDDELLRVIFQVYEWPHEGAAPDSASPGDTVSRWRAGVSFNVKSGNATHFWSNATTIPEIKKFAIKRRFNVSNLSGGR